MKRFSDSRFRKHPFASDVEAPSAWGQLSQAVADCVSATAAKTSEVTALYNTAAARTAASLEEAAKALDAAGNDAVWWLCAERGPPSLPALSDQGGSAAAAAAAQDDGDNLAALSVLELRALIRRGGLSDYGCVEKRELRDRAREAQARLRESATGRLNEGDEESAAASKQAPQKSYPERVFGGLTCVCIGEEAKEKGYVGSTEERGGGDDDDDGDGKEEEDDVYLVFFFHGYNATAVSLAGVADALLQDAIDLGAASTHGRGEEPPAGSTAMAAGVADALPGRTGLGNRGQTGGERKATGQTGGGTAGVAGNASTAGTATTAPRSACGERSGPTGDRNPAGGICGPPPPLPPPPGKAEKPSRERRWGRRQRKRLVAVLPDAGKRGGWWPLDWGGYTLASLAGEAAQGRLLRAVPTGLPQCRAAVDAVVADARRAYGRRRRRGRGVGQGESSSSSVSGGREDGEGPVCREDPVALSRCFFMGFSQGAMLALDTALRQRETVGGVVLVSGFLMDVDEWGRRLASKEHRDLRALQIHGMADAVVPFRTATWLQGLLANYSTRALFLPHSGGHVVPTAFVASAAGFLRSAIISSGALT